MSAPPNHDSPPLPSVAAAAAAPTGPLGAPAPATGSTRTTSKPIRAWKRRTDRVPAPSSRSSPSSSSTDPDVSKVRKEPSGPPSRASTPLRAQFSFKPKARQVSALSSKSAHSAQSARSARSTQSAQTARSGRSHWSGRSRSLRSIKGLSRLSNRSAHSARSGRSGHSHKDKDRDMNKDRARRLPPLDLHHPLSKLAEALDLANISAAPSAKERRATKAALALRQLILDPPQFELCAVALPSALTGLAPVGAGAGAADGVGAAPRNGKAGKGKVKGNGKDKEKGKVSTETPPTTGTPGALTTVGTKGKKSFVPRLREKDVSRLRTQLLKPTEAKMVIAHARSLPVAEKLSNNDRAVCLNCPEAEADTLIEAAHRMEIEGAARRREEERFDRHGDRDRHDRFATIRATAKAGSAPAHAVPAPPRLPVLLSLFSGLTAVGGMPGTGIDASITMLGLFEPASAMSLHRPLAGALPSTDTLRRGFDALINAESKVYMYQGPSHKHVYPPTDRMSVYTYWWGFELALPPATMKYLAHAKSIATSVLNLLSVIVYAVPGGTRELAPFVGVLSRFIDNEWALLKSQDKGKGVVCGATWFIPAALVARPWDFGEETIRDRIIAEEEKALLQKEPIDPSAVVKIKGPKGEEAQGVVVGIGKGLVKSKRSSPIIPWQPDTPPGSASPKDKDKGGKDKDGDKDDGRQKLPSVPGAPKRKPIALPMLPDPKPNEDNDNGHKGSGGESPDAFPQPPSIPVMPIFAVLGSISSSAPASPARTTPPTPAGAKFAKFGWRHRAFKAKNQNQDRDSRRVTQDATRADGGPESAGQDAADYSEAAPLEALSAQSSTSAGVGDAVLYVSGKVAAETVDMPVLLASQGAVPAPSSSSSADKPSEAELRLLPTPAEAGTAQAQTAMSRTMRRLKGTVGRLRSAIPPIPLNLASKIDPYPLAADDLTPTPAGYEYGASSGGGASAAAAGSRMSVGPAGGSEKRRSGLVGSFNRSGAQTVRELKRSLRAALPVDA